eukprot:jgi/Psemu1/9274/gm1.9274_g
MAKRELAREISSRMDLFNDPKLFGQAQYQSGAKNGITYLQTQDFNEAGEFQAYWKNACFDINWYNKRNKAINDSKNPLDPFNNLEHFVWCAMENIMTKWATCRCLEPSSIVKEDFETGVFSEGEFKTTLPCPYNRDPMSTYQTTIKLLSLVSDNCEGINWIFCKPASKKQKEASVIGKSRINEILVLIATWSGYDNPEQCTAHGKRHQSISKVVNAGVSASLVKVLGDHAHLNTTANYILLDQQAICTPVPAPAPALAPALAPAPLTLAPTPPSPDLSTEESQAPALFLMNPPQYLFSVHLVTTPMIQILQIGKSLLQSLCCSLICVMTWIHIVTTTMNHPHPSHGPRPTTMIVVDLLRIDHNMRIILASPNTIVLENINTIDLRNTNTIVLGNTDTRIAEAVDMRTAGDMRLVKNLAVSLLVNKLRPTSCDTGSCDIRSPYTRN